ncbi:hypothetical protein [Sulfurospirillum halorespirans]|uniref:Uncharacterized protein n=1 Tax=Sulfurospirillum halorespirans DSM 13726 TaxID=1193502 RepID=A0A1D7TKM3_9BACT|nr:hypothetical protein [Sulfurospirillum halorespirans]AOO65500.1 hypothetical protein SHALO_1729 [Sulfurospirillum halorespirans DSM 13726]
MEKIIDLLNRISELYAIPQWVVNSGAIAICIILLAFPFVARVLMRPKYFRFRELILFKVLWRWKYKKGDVIGLWCYCPKCQSMLMVDDENCRSEETLQHKITFFVCPTCGGHELGRVVGGDRRYVLSLVRRDIWRHIREGTYNEVATATKEALDIYAQLEEAKEQDESDVSAVLEETTDALSETVVPETSLPEENEEIPLHVNESEGVETVIPASEEASSSIETEEIKKSGI